jgi:hypothetical protein
MAKKRSSGKTFVLKAKSWFHAREIAKRKFRKYAMDYGRGKAIESLGKGRYKAYMKPRKTQLFGAGSAEKMAAKLNRAVREWKPKPKPKPKRKKAKAKKGKR